MLAWLQTLALTEHPARRWEPKRLRLRLLSIAGRLAANGRRRLLHLAASAPFTALALDALAGSTPGPRPVDRPHPVPTPLTDPGQWNPATTDDTGAICHPPNPQSPPRRSRTRSMTDLSRITNDRG